jgi:hypothetical protein
MTIIGVIFIIISTTTIIIFLFWYCYSMCKRLLTKTKQIEFKVVKSKDIKEVKEKVEEVKEIKSFVKLDQVKIDSTKNLEEKSTTPPLKETVSKDNNIYIYILSLTEGKYYIGKSKDPYKRLSYHLEGKGSEWTRLYKPIGIVSILPSSHIFDEDKYTLEYMLLYGIENVRGGNYVQLKLDQSQIAYIKKLFDGIKDRCYSCGSDSHFIRDCPVSKQSKGPCYKCGEMGHYATSCKSSKY